MVKSFDLNIHQNPVVLCRELYYPVVYVMIVSHILFQDPY